MVCLAVVIWGVPVNVYLPSSMFAISHTGNDYYYLLTGAAINSLAMGSASVGSYQLLVVASGSATSITTATPKNIGSLTLSPGIWDITGQVDYVLAGVTSLDFKSGSSPISATFGPQDSFANMPLIATGLSDTFGHVLPTWQLDNRTSGGTSVFLVGQANFTLGATSAYGTLRARKVG